MRGTPGNQWVRKLLMLTGAVLAFAASLLADLPPAVAGVTAAVLFLICLPVLGGLRERLQNTPALLAAAGLILLALHGTIG
ncbi:MAG: hypothetical protein M3O62_04065 [Pseudomonadota bacterium]|nr:hypothetical protein [Pseudomonadota bacterium]